MASTQEIQEIQNLKGVIDQLSTELAKAKKDRAMLILECSILANERDYLKLGGDTYKKEATRLKKELKRMKEEQS